MNEYSPNLAVIKKIRKETHDTNTYTLEFSDKKLQKSFSPAPGQFMMLSLFGYKVTQEELGKLANTKVNTGTVPKKLISAVNKKSNTRQAISFFIILFLLYSNLLARNN